MLPGDGIGPEISEATLAVLHEVDRTLGLGLEFEIRDIGLASLRHQGSTLPEEVVARVQEVNGVIWVHVFATVNGQKIEGWLLETTVSYATPEPNFEPSSTPTFGVTPAP